MTPATFWTSVRVNGECHEWALGRSSGAYGSAYIPGLGERRASRVAWVLRNGPIPMGLHVCHRCDNPACVKPGHLFLSTPFGNKIDSMLKGRHAPGCPTFRTRSCLRFQNQVAQRRARALTVIFLHLVAREAA